MDWERKEIEMLLALEQRCAVANAIKMRDTADASSAQG